MVRIFLFIFLLVGFVCQSIGAASPCKQFQCVAIIDCGSSGTRLHIYSYDLDKHNQPTDVKDFWSNKIKPGLTSLETESKTLHTYLDSLFKDIPEKNLNVYFYATGGMRLLPQVKQKKYFHQIKQWFKSHPQFSLVEAKTITGTEEGLYAWLAVNYRLSLLAPNKTPVSIFDMGGASVQLATLVKNTRGIEPSDLIQVKLGKQSYTLFVHSFIGLGQTIISYQFLDESTCFANNYQLPDGGQGKGDASLCQEDVTKLINVVHDVKKIKPILRENPATSWYTLGGLAALAISEPFHFQNNEFTSEKLIKKADSEVCRKQWGELEAKQVNNEFIYNYCLAASYYYALLVNGYGISPKQPIKLLSDKENADWTIGVVLEETVRD